MHIHTYIHKKLVCVYFFLFEKQRNFYLKQTVRFLSIIKCITLFQNSQAQNLRILLDEMITDSIYNKMHCNHASAKIATSVHADNKVLTEWVHGCVGLLVLRFTVWVDRNVVHGGFHLIHAAFHRRNIAQRRVHIAAAAAHTLILLHALSNHRRYVANRRVPLRASNARHVQLTLKIDFLVENFAWGARVIRRPCGVGHIKGVPIIVLLEHLAQYASKGLAAVVWGCMQAYNGQLQGCVRVHVCGWVGGYVHKGLATVHLSDWRQSFGAAILIVGDDKIEGNLHICVYVHSLRDCVPVTTND